MRDQTVHFEEDDQAASAATTPAAQSDAKVRLGVKLEYSRVAAAARKWWLAQGATLRDLTTWYKYGRGNVRVASEAAAAAEDAQAAHAADPDMVAIPGPPEAAKYYAIGTVEDDQFYMQCDGNYRGDNNLLPFTRSFAQTTLTFALGPPPAQYPALVSDYNAALGTLVSLLPANATVRSGHVFERMPTKHLRLRHAVFAVRPCDGSLLGVRS